MTDWSKQGYGPGTDVCCRCLRAKETARRGSKWCSKCDRTMRSRAKVDGALDHTSQGRVTRPTRIVK